MVPTDVDPFLPDLLSRVEREVTRRLTALLAAEGCTIDEWRVLSLLARTGGRPMTAIAQATLLLPPTLTKRVDRMVADGLVYRRVGVDDRRRVLVLLAPRGRTAHDRLAPLVAQEMTRLADQAPGVDLDRMTGLLGDLLSALELAPPAEAGTSGTATAPSGSVGAGGVPSSAGGGPGSA
jgi:DNA-binding MarR family transcriptional regulator